MKTCKILDIKLSNIINKYLYYEIKEGHFFSNYYHIK